MATFRKLPSGRWQARVSIDGTKQSIGTFKTKKEAQIKAQEVESQLFYNQTINDRNIRFQEVIDSWFDYKEKTVVFCN